MDQTTRINIGVSANINLGDFNNIKFSIDIDDYVRSDEKTSAAVDRVMNLVEAKLAEKVSEYKT